MLQLIECPRDAMQGLHDFVPTEIKVKYINQLLQVGYHTIDCGSFVSPKAIPQMKDTGEVIDKLDLSNSISKLLVIVANKRGAEDAVKYEKISYLGYPFSISETFQLRNTNATIEESLERVAHIQDLCLKHGKELVLYLSMGFGNPYGDPWNADIIQFWVDKLVSMGIKIFSLSDTIGVAKPDSISYIFSSLIPVFENITFGAHFHTRPDDWGSKLDAAFASGCRRFDSAIKGYGGCPMAKDDLTGNLATENLLFYLRTQEKFSNLNMQAFIDAMQMAATVFPFKY